MIFVVKQTNCAKVRQHDVISLAFFVGQLKKGVVCRMEYVFRIMWLRMILQLRWSG